MSERPLECGECKKPIKVCYTEIVGDVVVRTSMCADCPELQKRLHGIPASLIEGKVQAGLCCGNCETTLDAIRQGAALGCSECYEVFGDILAAELFASVKPGQATATGMNKKNLIVHRGRSPGQITEMTPALRILALNDALKETLSREDYEQAAWLRDQIKELTDGGADERKK